MTDELHEESRMTGRVDLELELEAEVRAWVVIPDEPRRTSILINVVLSKELHTHIITS